MFELLAPAEIYRAYALAVEGAIRSLAHMDYADCAVAEEFFPRFGAQDMLVLCGPGNNGGDRFVCAR